MQVQKIATRARAAAQRLGNLSSETKNQALEAIAAIIIDRQAAILDANAQDVERTAHLVESGDMSPALLARLKLNPQKVLEMATGVRSVADLPDPVSPG